MLGPSLARVRRKDAPNNPGNETSVARTLDTGFRRYDVRFQLAFPRRRTAARNNVQPADNAKLRAFRPKAQTKRFNFVVPAKAGTHASRCYQAWIPAFAGMTV